MNRLKKILILREPHFTALSHGVTNSPLSGLGKQNHVVTRAAKQPGNCGCFRSARHSTRGPSKSTALNFPYSRTCSSTGSVRR
jgi:hypothetical protein